MKRLRHDMFACGQAELPQQINCNGKPWQLETIFKHDFFACTGRYHCQQTGKRIVLKIGRLQSFLGISCMWIGRFLINREIKILKHLEEISQIPKLVKPFGRNGMIYSYIPGKTLDEKPPIPDAFFDRLETLLEAIHKHDVCYMDLNKRGNIILGEDRKPYLIDFQISLRMPAKWTNPIKNCLQHEDFYHLFKHKRRMRPDLMTDNGHMQTFKPSFLIRVHRIIAWPFRGVRRPLMRLMYRKKILGCSNASDRTPENNPRRFLK